MKILTSVSSISILLLTTSQAYALSCAQTGFDLEATFQANKTANKNVIYVLGSFSGKQSKTKQLDTKPVAGSNGISIVTFPKATTSNLVFSGKVMTKNGTKPFKQKVKITASCIASWCGNIPKSGQKTIAALTKTTSGYAMTAGPCAPNTFSSQINKDWTKLKKLVR